jgi:hypothetical protein
LVADPYSIFHRCRNYFSKLFNVPGVYDFRGIEILVHKAKPVLPETSAYDLELAIEKVETQITRY